MLRPEKILLVGYRKDALRIAINSFSHVELLVSNETKVSKSLNLKKIYYYHNDKEPPVLDSPPDLCLPLTESSVVMAALIVDRYKTKGYPSSLLNASHDKLVLKDIAHKNKIPISKYCQIQENCNTKELIETLELPIIIKQRSSSGSRGLQYCNNETEVKNNLVKEWIAESFIQGKEYSAEIFIINKKIIFKNFTNYYERLKINILPHEFNKQDLTLVNELINKLVKAYNIDTAFLHIEFFLNNNNITFGEFAVRPPGGYLMKLIKHSYDFNPWDMYFKLFLENSDNKKLLKPKKYSAVIILHPGAGTIDKITGVNTVKSLNSFYSLKLKKNIGEKIRIREGSGQDIGYIILINSDQKALLSDITSLQEAFQVLLK